MTGQNNRTKSSTKKYGRNNPTPGSPHTSNNTPNICDHLFRLFKSCFQNCVVPVQWRIATEVYIPKSGSPDPNNIKDFRPIYLLDVERKLFFSILSKRLEKHIITN